MIQRLELRASVGSDCKRMLFWHWLSIRDDLGKLTGGKESDRVWIVVLIYDRWTLKKVCFEFVLTGATLS